MERLVWRLTAIWMLGLGAVHVHWGLGGTALRPARESLPDRPLTVGADVVAVAVCLAGATLAWLLRPDQHPRRLLARRWLLWPGRVGSVVMLALALLEPSWLLAGLLLAATVTSCRRAADGVQSLQRNRREASAVATTPQTAITSHSPSSA